MSDKAFAADCGIDSSAGRIPSAMRYLTYAIAAAAFALLLGVSARASSQSAPEDDPEPDSDAGVSVAHAWVDAALFAVRKDFARPTVHARNLYHLSAAMYDAWAVYAESASPLWLRPEATIESCRLATLRRDRARAEVDGLEAARRAAVGRAAWDFLRERYATSPNVDSVMEEFRRVAVEQGVAAIPSSESANIGAHAAACVLATGRADASNEIGGYANLDYTPVNPPLDPTAPGNPTLRDPNRWQPLSFENFIDQSGNEADASEFLGAEWGRLEPFALPPDARSEVTRDGTTYPLWLDPGPPPRLGDDDRENEAYARHFALVALWSGHLDPADGVMLDISPGAIGNAAPLADRIEDPLRQLDASGSRRTDRGNAGSSRR